tara:strand:+ start:1489 stop:2154 length:666 start_codon:yes stop_codon:yes gene_type:complete
MSNYFRNVPNFDYVSRLPNAKISDYVTVKNFFKRGFLREDIFQELSFFTKYKIKGDDRPDNVAWNFYQESQLDWLVLTCNNIVNIQTEWPLTQTNFDRFLLDKYETHEKLNDIHHYETIEIKNTDGNVLLKEGLEVDKSFSMTYYDDITKKQVTPTVFTKEITNYQFEEKIENEKRNIYLLKPRYLNIIYDDMEEMMSYIKGSSQYKTETLKVADNIRLYI